MSLLGYDKLRRISYRLCISTPKLNILCARVDVLLECKNAYITASFQYEGKFALIKLV